jgi:alcohol dehydrogenase class IV
MTGSIGLQHVTPAFRTFCGEQALTSLPRELARVGARRAVVVCGGSMVRRHPEALARVEDAVADRLAGRFDGVQEHSPVPSVRAARDVLRATEADAVIAVGGGSAIVTARAATILLAEPRDVQDLRTRRDSDGRLISPRLQAPKLPQWVVPTTPTTAYAKAGSAVRDPDTNDRLAMFDPKTRAQGVFLDPELSLTAPVSLAEGSGLNAFAMAVEGLQSNFDDPLAEALLAQALRMLVRWLPQLHRAPNDPEPRLRLMLAALLCGQGSDYAGGGLAQALAHAAGPRSDVSNGVIEALLLPHTIEFNAPVTQLGLTRVVDALDGGRPARSTSERAARSVRHLLADLELPLRLREAGVQRDALGEIAQHALDDWWLSRAPRPAGADDVDALLDAAW